MALNIIIPDGVKRYVVTHMAKELVNRQRKYVEYFSSGASGEKYGVSLEWVTRDDVWKNLSDGDLQNVDWATALLNRAML